MREMKEGRSDDSGSYSPVLRYRHQHFLAMAAPLAYSQLKNDLILTGTLHSVDQYLNMKLSTVTVVGGEKYPQLGGMKNVFVR